MSEGPVLRLERTFDAPREEVFAAWTSPEVLRRWWAAAPGWECTTAEVDLRVGGRYRLAMRESPEAAPYAVGGEYLEVDPPERLVYTWTWEGDPESQRGSRDSVVTVRFLPAGSGTTVELVHEGFATPDVRDRHAHGWMGVLDNLAARGLGAPRAL
jgi:uncharacterized protein YndB with AHSA1/START domain